ncbi:MAG: LPS export ABC transporter periplasmic protein LptC [Sulfuriferula sp.]|nr:LPS export ABC transporter periplasmic protein LptC [Sulfuriferula sp.]
MNTRPLIWFPLSIMLILAALTAWLQFAVQSPHANAFSHGAHIADYMMEKFAVSRTNLAGQLIYTLRADYAEHFMDDDTTRLRQPHLLANDDQQGTADIRANRALVSAKGKQVDFFERVVLIRDTHDAQGAMTLTTEHLTAWPDARIMRADKLVHVTGKNIQMTAGGLELNNTTRILRLTNRVKAQYEPIK